MLPPRSPSSPTSIPSKAPLRLVEDEGNLSCTTDMSEPITQSEFGSNMEEDEEEEVSSDSSRAELECNEHDIIENKSEAIENDEDKVENPEMGMKFNTSEEAYMYYSRYGKQNGFAIYIRSSKKGRDGNLRNVTLQCTRGGKARVRTSNPVKPRPQTRTDCKACINISLCPDRTWILNRFELKHNHEMSPGKSIFFKCNRIIDEPVKRRLELHDKSGIRMNKTITSLVIQAGGHENLPFLEKDCRNYMDKIRRLQLKKGDAAAMHEYFLKMTADNSEFFSAMDLSDKGRLMNVFWADARSRAAFKEFGDVVTFDTTYLVNKYDMPFAPFVGVNHHGQSILLGCGLISHETTESFSWLFRTWLTCMGNSPPKAIITDQDKAMKKAIEIVLPDTRHRWCLWHIMKKLPEKLRGYKDYEQIKWCLQNAVYDSLSKEEFEKAWGMFIEKYQLQSNEWLLGLYKERSRWVPTFVKDAFWAGMSTTQRSESMHHYFDGYINSRTTLKQFVEQYENALAQKVENETNADSHSLNSYIPCIIGSEMEQQFQSEYTNAKFKEFNEQFVGKLSCSISTKNRGDTFSYYDVQEVVTFGEEKKRRRVTFTVSFEEASNEAKCNCQLFEFKGILCRHQMMVFHDRGIDRVPEAYVLKRWSKIVKRGHTKVRIKYDNSVRTIEACRYDNMCNFFPEAAELAQVHRERYDTVMAQIRDWKEKWKEPLVVCGSNTVELAPISGGHNDSPSVGDGRVVSKESTTILDPLIVRKRGRPPVNRKQGYMEKILKNPSKGKTKTKSKRTKEIVEDVGHVLGTQESANVNNYIRSHIQGQSHTSCIGGQSYEGWRPPVPYQYYGQPNTVQGGGNVPFHPSSQNSQVLVGQPSLQNSHMWGGPSLSNAQAWGGPSLSNAQAWGGPSLSNAQGGPSLSNAQAWGGQPSLVELLNAINRDK